MGYLLLLLRGCKSVMPDLVRSFLTADGACRKISGDDTDPGASHLADAEKAGVAQKNQRI